MRHVEFHPAARAEFLAAIRFCDERTADLRDQFVAAVEATAFRVAKYPNSGRPFGRHFRRALVPRFPYGLIYRVKPTRVRIVSVFHLRRRPRSWPGRV